MEQYVITISRQFGSLGRSIAQCLANKLGINFYDRDIVEQTAKRLGQPVSVISEEEENAASRGFFKRIYPLGMGMLSMQEEIFQVQENIIRDLAAKESCIIVGRCGNYILRDHKNSLHIYIFAPYEKRMSNCTNILGMDTKTAMRYIKEVDRAREKYRKRFGNESENGLDGYDLLIDSSRLGVEKTADMLADIIRKELN